MLTNILTYHIIAFLLGFCLDLLAGDPYWLPHPVRLLGHMISALEHILYGEEKEPNKLLKRGSVLAAMVIIVTAVVSFLLLVVSYWIHPYIGVTVEAVMTYQLLAIKCLKKESMKVHTCLQKEDLEGARKAVSMIVGRDTDSLDSEGVTKAAIETVAENTADGVIAPMLYTALFGPVSGFVYKAVNTMDSMIGYKNERYLYFGRAAAKTDDLLNYLPSRISAWLMLLSCIFMGNAYDFSNAAYIYRRDCRKHASPNSAQTESVCAGALGIRLAGDACYFGKIVKKPFIGDALRKVEYEDIRRANRILYVTAFLCAFLCLILLCGVRIICLS